MIKNKFITIAKEVIIVIVPPHQEETTLVAIIRLVVSLQRCRGVHLAPMRRYVEQYQHEECLAEQFSQFIFVRDFVGYGSNGWTSAGDRWARKNSRFCNEVSFLYDLTIDTCTHTCVPLTKRYRPATFADPTRAASYSPAKINSKPAVAHRSVTMSSNPPYVLHWSNLRAASPSNRSPTKEAMYSQRARNHRLGWKIMRRKLTRVRTTRP